jgi:hypothetical protein
MVKTTLVANTSSFSDKENKGIEVGIVSGYSNGKHTHEYQIFNLENPTPNVGLIGVNNQEVFSIQLKFTTYADFAFAIYLDGINISQKNGIHSLNQIPEERRMIYKAHNGLFITRNTKKGTKAYINRYSQANGENRLFTFTTAANSGINEVLINDPSLTNRIEVYTWQDIEEEYDSMIDNFSPSDNNSSTKVGAGNATNVEYKKARGLDNPEFLGKVMFSHTNAKNVAHLGKALLSLEEIEKLNYDPMNRVPRT